MNATPAASVEARIMAAIAHHWPRLRLNPSVLLHGDYWPGNILWRDGTIEAVVDWEEAQFGDPALHLGDWSYDPATERAMRARLVVFIELARQRLDVRASLDAT
jgi:aminoglycoside phosphotransferase (APT) family kinase protein